MERLSILYYRLYAPVADFIWRVRHRDSYYKDHGPAPCQLCGEQGHIEKDCPRKKEMGFD